MESSDLTTNKKHLKTSKEQPHKDSENSMMTSGIVKDILRRNMIEHNSALKTTKK